MPSGAEDSSRHYHDHYNLTLLYRLLPSFMYLHFKSCASNDPSLQHIVIWGVKKWNDGKAVRFGIQVLHSIFWWECFSLVGSFDQNGGNVAQQKTIFLNPEIATLWRWRPCLIGRSVAWIPVASTWTMSCLGQKSTLHYTETLQYLELIPIIYCQIVSFRLRQACRQKRRNALPVPKT